MRRPIAGILVAFLVAGCGGVLPRESDNNSAAFKSHEDVAAAYARIEAGKTRRNDLAALGFDPLGTPNIEVLSSVGVTARFLPSEAMKMERLPPAVRTCIEAQDRCSAYVYRLERSDLRRNGMMVTDLLGFERDTVKTGWSAEIVLLLQDDRVVYKTILSRPNIEDRHEKSQPLGPVQDLGELLVPQGPP